MMNSSKEVMEMILELAKEKKISMSQLAEKVGVAKSSLSRYKNGEREFPINDIGKYASVLNVSVEYLLGLNSEEKQKESRYNYYPVSISAGLPINVDGITNDDVEQISIPDSVMKNHAGSKDVFFMKTNGESMNNVIPHDSLIAVKHTDISNLSDGDIVVYSCDHEYAVKRFYNDKANKRFIFKPDSTDLSFIDNVVTYEESKNLKLYGKVVLYIVNLD